MPWEGADAGLPHEKLDAVRVFGHISLDCVSRVL
jgi:hypothetical protein